MTDKAAYTVGDSAASGEGPAAVYPSFKPTEDSAHGVGRLQALDDRGVAKGSNGQCTRTLLCTCGIYPSHRFPHPAGTFENIPAPSAKDVGWAKFLVWEGGTEWDAFFTAASAQVTAAVHRGFTHAAPADQT